MRASAFLEVEFLFLVVFSFVLPGVVYAILYRKTSISRLGVLFFAACLIVMAGIDVALLSLLRDLAVRSGSAIDYRFFISELRLAFYLLPVVFVGTGVNLISHVLIQHLTRAEQKFDRKH